MIPLSLHAVSKQYENLIALQDVSLTLQPQEIFGLIGLNGAGKTTLIKSILQLTSPDSGEIRVFDIPAQEVKARQNLVYLPEKFLPSKYLTGKEYLELSVSYYGQALHADAMEQEAVALDFPLEKLTHKIASYSKGTAQKLGLMGVFLTQRPLIILDEPMSGLDPLARIRLKQRMKACKAAGSTLFFSSHILSDIDEICDRMAILHHGQLRYSGAAAAFKSEDSTANLEQCFLAAIQMSAA
jgi:ABC-2 type transport system ATP-binding protein